MTSYFLSFSWGICILLSFIGWGGIINRILFPKYQVEWGQRAACGIAFTVFVGGVLNATYSISRAVILIYLGLGLLYCLGYFFKTSQLSIKSFSYFRHYPKDWVFTTGVAIVLFFIVVQYAGSVHTQHFNLHDDYHAYFVFPHKMLQMHSMGPDPFSERRILSLGGQSFLHTLILSMLGEENLHIIDPGVALIVVSGLLLGYFRDKRIPKRKAAFLSMLFFFVPFPQANTTSAVTSTALMLSLFRVLDRNKLNLTGRTSNACIIALVTAALCSLKSSNIPFCGVLLLSSYIFYFFNSRGSRVAVIGELFMFSILTFMFLFPWMVSMYQSCGTALYPILGKGYHGSVYGSFSVTSSVVTLSGIIKIIISSATTSYLGAFLVLFVIGIKPLSTNIPSRAALLSVMISAVLGTLMLALAIEGYGIHRYSFFLLHTAVIILIPIAYDAGADKGRLIRTGISLTVVIVVIACVLAQTVKYSYKEHLRFFDNIKAGLSNTTLISDAERHQYTAMQQALPDSETVLTRLKKPFLLNFDRNRILIVDYPGGSSPPPGMPFFKGAEALADYLVSQSIRYVAYSYASEAWFTKKAFKHRLKPEVHPWIRSEARHTFDFQDNLKQLGETRERIYDNNDIFVLDLLRRCGQQ